MFVNTHTEPTVTYDVIGFITGSHEPGKQLLFICTLQIIEMIWQFLLHGTYHGNIVEDQFLFFLQL